MLPLGRRHPSGTACDIPRLCHSMLLVRLRQTLLGLFFLFDALFLGCRDANECSTSFHDLVFYRRRGHPVSLLSHYRIRTFFPVHDLLSRLCSKYAVKGYGTYGRMPFCLVRLEAFVLGHEWHFFM